MNQNYKIFYNEIEGMQIKRFSKISLRVELILVVSILIYLFFKVPNQLLIVIALLLYATYGFFAYLSKYKIKDYKKQIMINAVVMVIYISLAVFYTGNISSPFFSIYYLPLILLTITLNNYSTLFILSFITLLFFIITKVIFVNSMSLFFIDIVPLWLVTIVAILLAREVKNAKIKLEKLSQTDSLTGLWNMRMFNLMAEREHLRINRNNSVFSIIMLDADNLKDVNDEYGHQAGSKLIQHMGNLIQTNLRATDLVARYGGDEFVIMLPETDSSYAHMVAERIRSTIETTPLKLKENQIVNISVSLGIASSTKNNNNIQDIMFMADKALYDSKKTGKNRTTIFTARANERI